MDVAAERVFEEAGPSQEARATRATAGVCVSGTSFAILRLGQRCPPPQDSPISSGQARGSSGRQAERGGGSGTPVRRLHVSLKQLILANLIEPGPSAVELRYKGMAFPASLERDGKISFEGSSFATASAFSIHVIRRFEPTKPRDDGWKSVYHKGKQLDHYKRIFVGSGGAQKGEEATGGTARRGRQARASQATTAPEGSARGPQRGREAIARPGRARQSSSSGEEGDKWVQCDRCKQWRIVPDAHWPQIESAGDAAWFCESATWDVRTTQPNTPPCTE